MITSTEDQEAFEEIGRLIGQLFTGAIRHAAGVTPDAAALLVESFRADRSSVRAIVSMSAPGSVVFELRDARGEWQPAITLKGEGRPELKLN